jgi:large subunit ribosomal protein L21
VVEKLDGEAGQKVAFDQVLMLGDGASVTVGAPLVDGAVVDATLIETRKGDKVKIFKKIRRQGYRRTKGHRQLESVLRVTAITGAGQSATWDGEVDLTPKAVLDARARGLYVAAPAPKAEAAPAAKSKAPAKPKAGPKPAPEAEAPQVEAVQAEAPAVEAKAPKAEPKAKAAPKAKAEAKAEPAAKAEPKAKAEAKTEPKAKAAAKPAAKAKPKSE